MSTDRLAQAVRHHLGLGALLPLGGPADGAWIAERAARAVLRDAVDALPGVRLGALRIELADPDEGAEPGVPAPPGALPPGPLWLGAQCAATPDEPLPESAERLRAALARAADERLGLRVTVTDVRVTALLEPGRQPDAPAPSDPPAAAGPPAPDRAPAETDDAARVATAALAVPGVTRLTGALAGLGRSVRVERHGGGEDAALPRVHVRVELAVAAGARALDVTRAVREAVVAALPDRPTVAVLVTEARD
jgi:hypothetical protein